MKYQVLLLWTLTALVSCQDKKSVLKVEKISNGIQLSCGDNFKVRRVNHLENQLVDDTLKLSYRDENSGEYECVSSSSDPAVVDETIYVKFRTCDSCIELDLASLISMAMGEVVATTVVGVAVYFIVSQARTGGVTSKKKSSDKQQLVPAETSRSTNEHYQPLRPKEAQKRDVYDEIVPNKKKEKKAANNS